MTCAQVGLRVHPRRSLPDRFVVSESNDVDELSWLRLFIAANPASFPDLQSFPHQSVRLTEL